ncbi:MAG: ferrochelatase [Planctomycetaceae bacterium]|nr:ferrochelatase [Planctomycetaceae bacterium]
MTASTTDYDAILLVSFGGPEGPDDVMPFLENVLRGKNVPRERMLEVAKHYNHFGGVSPINAQCRDLLDALRPELAAHGINLPIYWGNRNWDPMLPDTLSQMKADGIQRALAFVTSSCSSYSSCRQYRENIADAQTAAGDGAPQVDKIRVFYNHPDFIDASAVRVHAAIDQIPVERRARLHIAFTAHSIPTSMSESCDYVKQLSETSRLVATAVGIPEDRWKLVYQSRSGPPQIPWLEPDICNHLRAIRSAGVEDVIVMPIGFLSDHMEVMFDLDEEARDVCDEIGLNMVRAATVGTHPRFITMIRKLIEERLSGAARKSVGQSGPSHDVCPLDCCPRPQHPPRQGTATQADLRPSPPK